MQLIKKNNLKNYHSKWIACWPEGMEAWAEQRRTGYPKLFKVQTNNSNGTIDTDIMIRRLPFSQDDAKKILSSIKICVRLLVVQTMAVHGYGGTQVKQLLIHISVTTIIYKRDF